MGGNKTIFVDPIYPGAPGGVGFPGGRFEASVWQDSTGLVWLFGGATTPDYNAGTKL